VSDAITLVVLLRVHAGRGAEYERFEAAASRVMRRYGGSIERRIALAGGGSERPDEVHLVRFPDAESFARYRADPPIGELAALRASAIRDTTIWEGREAPAFDEERSS
jgi:antibiotic biosynthesis monooxygenase (ABM) superfamily enzyme